MTVSFTSKTFDLKLLHAAIYSFFIRPFSLFTKLISHTNYPACKQSFCTNYHRKTKSMKRKFLVNIQTFPLLFLYFTHIKINLLTTYCKSFFLVRRLFSSYVTSTLAEHLFICYIFYDVDDLHRVL